MQGQDNSGGTADRKQDHIDLAFKSGMGRLTADERFYYEPMLAGHPPADLDISVEFLGKTLRAPMWVSSMTGGTEKALMINRRLAEACGKFGLGMGLGSCRPLLDSLDRLQDFDIRDIIGPHLPLYANLGIAQIEELFAEGRAEEIGVLIDRLRADGLIIHVNPLQEWLQPEGDHILSPPIDTIGRVLDHFSFPVVVKEVGQGFGPGSIAALMQLPVAAIELAAHGGTNFAKLELLRSDEQKRNMFEAVARLGHSPDEMIEWINLFPYEEGQEARCTQFIISGGVGDFLDGYYYLNTLRYTAVYGQASAFLRYATVSQEALDQFIASQIQGLKLAQTFLQVR